MEVQVVWWYWSCELCSNFGWGCLHSLWINAFGKGMNPSVLFLLMSYMVRQTRFSNLWWIINLRGWIQNLELEFLTPGSLSSVLVKDDRRWGETILNKHWSIFVKVNRDEELKYSKMLQLMQLLLILDFFFFFFFFCANGCSIMQVKIVLIMIYATDLL